ncbi:MAG: MFS transporter [Victivallaceae bacterium]|nr:MFS transporter [Victivallaceae bacterium]
MRAKLHFGRYDYAVYVAFIAYAMCSLSIPLVLVEMGKDLHFPLDDGGMTAGGTLHCVRSCAILLALLVCGVLAGRFGKRKMMGLASLLMGCGILLCAAAPAYFFLLPFLLTAGLGEGICEGLATPFVQDLHSDAPERYVNLAHSMWSAGIFLCVMVSGFLLTAQTSWRVVLLVCALLALLASLMFYWKESPTRKYPEAPRQANAAEIRRRTAEICKCPRFWLFCFGMFAGAGAEFCLTFWTASYLLLYFRATPWTAGFGTAAIALGMFCGRTVFGYFAKPRYLKHLLLACAVAMLPFTFLLIFIRPESFSSSAALFGVLWSVLFVCGVGVAPFWPTLQVYGVNELPEYDSTLLYIYFSAMGVPGCGFFTWIMGFLGDRIGLRGAFFMLPVSLLLYGAIILWAGWIFPRKTGIPAVRDPNRK